MNNLIKLIIEVFRANLMSIFVIDENKKEMSKSHTFGHIYKSSLEIANILNNTYKDKNIKIVLLLDNSIEWVIWFFGVILSKHKLIIIPNNIDNESLSVVIINSGATLIVTSEERNLPELIWEEYNIHFVETPIPIIDPKIINRDIIDLSPQLDNLIIYTPKYTNDSTTWIKEYVEYDEIINSLKKLGKDNIFKDCLDYIVPTDFAYTYILNILLPFTEGITVIIPHKNKDNYGMKVLLQKYQLEVVIFTARQFKALYKEYIDCPRNKVMEILKELRWGWIRNYLLRKKVKVLFPNLKKLIILNSYLDYNTSRTIEKLKLPAQYLFEENWSKDYTGNGVLTIDGFRIFAKDIENSYSTNPLVDDALVIQRNNKLILYLKINKTHADYLEKSVTDCQKIFEEQQANINFQVATYTRINQVVAKLSDFYRDAFGNIIRERYLQEGESVS